MTIFKSYIFPLFIGLFALTSCDTLVQEVSPDKIPPVEQKLVVHCFISPQDTMFTAMVSLTQTVLGVEQNAQNESIRNATIRLSDGVNTVSFTRDESLRLYKASAKGISIQAGKTYTLTVSTTDGRRVSATTTVPQPVNITKIEIDSIPDSYSPSLSIYRTRFFWNDPQGTKNYYKPTGRVEYGFRTQVYEPNKPPKDTVYRNFQSFGVTEGYVTDANGNGGTISTGWSNIYLSTRSSQGFPVFIVTGYLLNLGEDYYKYHEAIDRWSSVEDNPFAEPVLIPSNIQGGLGCFGSYNRTSLVFDKNKR